jgi:hypothetical protein
MVAPVPPKGALVHNNRKRAFPARAEEVLAVLNDGRLIPHPNKVLETGDGGSCRSRPRE